MKKIMTLALAASISLSAVAQKKATVELKSDSKAKVEKVYLTYRYQDDRVTDSATFKDGSIVFKTPLTEPTSVFLRIAYPKGEGETSKAVSESKQLFLEPGIMKIKIQDSLKDAKVKGGKAQEDFEKQNKWMEPFNEKSKALSAQYMQYRKDKDQAGMDKVEKEFEAMDSTMNQDVYLKFLKENPKSPIALYTLENYAGYDIDPSVIEPMFDKLSQEAKNTASGKAFSSRINIAKKTAVGAMAMDFTQNDTLEKPVSLHDFKGKYVLVDFWASWCGPCRAENPNVVKAYNKYKDKNFTVLGVSLDQPGKKQSWLDAIHKDSLTWTHVSDLKFWNNAVAQQYGIRAISQNLLIDPSGKIIAKNIRGEELNQKLDEIFD